MPWVAAAPRQPPNSPTNAISGAPSSSDIDCPVITHDSALPRRSIGTRSATAANTVPMNAPPQMPVAHCHTSASV